MPIFKTGKTDNFLGIVFPRGKPLFAFSIFSISLYSIEKGIMDGWVGGWMDRQLMFHELIILETSLNIMLLKANSSYFYLAAVLKKETENSSCFQPSTQMRHYYENKVFLRTTGYSFLYDKSHYSKFKYEKKTYNQIISRKSHVTYK